MLLKEEKQIDYAIKVGWELPSMATSKDDKFAAEFKRKLNAQKEKKALMKECREME